MGTVEVLTRRIKEIIYGKANFIQKVDMILFLMQYFPVALTFIAALVLSLYSIIARSDPLNSPILFFIWASILGIYAVNFVQIARKNGLDFITALRSLGKVSAYTVAISPFMLVSMFNAIKKDRKYIVTPKGKVQKTTIQYIILIFGILFFISSLIYLFHGILLSGIWLLYYSAAYIFTSWAYRSEIQ
ncbi:hypothetical protein HLB03_04525 [Acidianus sp. DSM 29099]|nr:hypothetical protein [Acidianus sp. RZ1]